MRKRRAIRCGGNRLNRAVKRTWRKDKKFIKRKAKRIARKLF